MKHLVTRSLKHIKMQYGIFDPKTLNSAHNNMARVVLSL